MLFTNRRVIFVDNKKVGIFGLGGKKAEYLTIPYRSISHFAVQTSGGGFIFKDRDAELQIWTDVPDFTPEVPESEEQEHVPPQPGACYFEQDLAKDKVDLLGIHRYLSEKLLSLSYWAYSNRTTAIGTAEIVHPGLPGDTNFLNLLSSLFSDNAREVDPVEMNTKFHAPGSELL